MRCFSQTPLDGRKGHNWTLKHLLTSMGEVNGDVDILVASELVCLQYKSTGTVWSTLQ